MACRLLKRRRLVIVLIITSSLFSFFILLRLPNTVGRWMEDEYPGHSNVLDVEENGSDKSAANNQKLSRKVDGDFQTMQQTHKVNSSKDAKLVVNDIAAPNQRCVKSLSIFSNKLRRWTEYESFLRLFKKKAIKSRNGLQTLRVQCPKQLCDLDIQVSQNAVYLNASVALVVNMFPQVKNMTGQLAYLRQVLNPNIHWFFYGVESPQQMTRWNKKIGDIQYHHSITYHSTADIRLPYGEYVPGKPNKKALKDIDWTVNKTGLIAWMASNCNGTYWPRYEFIQKLQKHLPASIDTYGKCGTMQWNCLPRMSTKCARSMAQYKFYLALENSECDEYISDKVWINCLPHGVVPVVYGGRKESYERLLPPKSFIHVSDFNSTEDLASYLKALDRDRNMYNMYHAWRSQGTTRIHYPPLNPNIFCQAIRLVSDPPPPFKTVKNSDYLNSCKNLNGSFAKELATFIPWT